MSWYISAQNAEKTETRKFWISDIKMFELSGAAIHNAEALRNFTCDGCIFECEEKYRSPCSTCKRKCTDYYTEVVS